MAYRHGQFTWLENITQDVEASRAFYSALFGWDTQAEEMENGNTYTVINNPAGNGIGGILTPPIPPGAPAPPPHWSNYLSVPDVDATLAAIGEAGGATVMPAMDIPGVGRIAVAQDPQGAMFHLWKGLTEDPSATDEPGDRHWTELWSNDPDASVAFYTKVFGFGSESTEMPEGPYHVLAGADGAMLGGVLQNPVEGAPSSWVSYVHVADADATAAKVTELGGKVLMPPMSVEQVGRFFVFADPQGATLGVITPGKHA